MRKRIVRGSAVAFVALCLAGCTGRDATNPLDGLDTIQAEVDTVAKSNTCVYPVQMEKIGKHLVVLDKGNQSSALASYDLNGREELHFANKGHTANEVDVVQSFHKMDESRLAIAKRQGLLVFDVDSLCGGGERTSEFRRTPDFPYVVTDFDALAGGFLAVAFSDSARFCFATDRDSVSTYNHYPAGFVDKAEDLRAVVNYNAQFRTSGASARFCVGTYIGGLLETFAVRDGRIENIGSCVLYKSKYNRLEDGAVSWDATSTIGFDDISAGEHFIFTLLNQNEGKALIEGDKNPFARAITVFDWEARPRKIIAVGVPLMCLCACEEDAQAYAIHYGADGLYLLRLRWDARRLQPR